PFTASTPYPGDWSKMTGKDAQVWPAGWKRGGSMTEQAQQVTQTAQNSGNSQTSLEIRHLFKRYANADKPVLDDI
ncbi:hypothetical protein NE594_10030, partial [Bifidobacterium adolescentis]|nr:hypothetical protein [Bifidobacterium adolescentis]